MIYQEEVLPMRATFTKWFLKTTPHLPSEFNYTNENIYNFFSHLHKFRQNGVLIIVEWTKSFNHESSINTISKYTNGTK
jgi:hypothetical protein